MLISKDNKTDADLLLNLSKCVALRVATTLYDNRACLNVASHQDLKRQMIKAK